MLPYVASDQQSEKASPLFCFVRWRQILPKEFYRLCLPSSIFATTRWRHHAVHGQGDIDISCPPTVPTHVPTTPFVNAVSHSSSAAHYCTFHPLTVLLLNVKLLTMHKKVCLLKLMNTGSHDNLPVSNVHAGSLSETFYDWGQLDHLALAPSHHPIASTLHHKTVCRGGADFSRWLS